MIACLDVHYSVAHANAAAIVFSRWEAPSAVSQYTAMVSQAAEYEPGRFYLRELRPLLSVIAQIVEAIDVFVIDGYCHLSSDGAPGLGHFLNRSLNSNAVIVGVAKNRYRDTRHAAELLRGRSTRPLFITAIGADYHTASQHIASMAGEFRVPTLLKAVDRLSRLWCVGPDAS